VSGLGGDELLNGYSTFREVPLLARALWLPAKIPSLGEWVRRGVVAFDPVRWRLSPKTAGLLLYGGSYPGAYFLRRGLFMPWELEGLLPREVVVEGLERLNPTEHVRRTLEPDPKNAFRRVAILEATHYLRNQLLRDTDWASMAHSLEVRVPLVDFTLLRELAPVLPRLGSNGKQTLGSCPRPPLPAEVLERRKTGFGLPLSEWLAQPNLGLDTWRRVPALAADGCHWSRRLAYALAHRVMSAAL
jgi:asparagine synthase (glutamine-hydrolysing)